LVIRKSISNSRRNAC